MQVQSALDIPQEYQDLAEVFRKREGMESLQEHQPWKHTIPLVERKEPRSEPIRPLNEEQTKALREYIKEMLAKRWIRE
jgi:hypothetical protein